MRVELFFATLPAATLLFMMLAQCAAVVLFVSALALPSDVFADVVSKYDFSLVWSGVVMSDGGTYRVPLNTPGQAYVIGTEERMPDGGWIFMLFGDLYKLNGLSREYVQKVQWRPPALGGRVAAATGRSGRYRSGIHALMAVRGRL